MCHSYPSANAFVANVAAVTAVKKVCHQQPFEICVPSSCFIVWQGYGKSIGVMELRPPLKVWFLKKGVSIDMKVSQKGRRSSVSLAITFTTTIVGATNVDTAAVKTGATDPAALVANINAVIETEKATGNSAYADFGTMPASAVTEIKPPAPPPSADSFMAAQAGSAEDDDGAPVALIVIGSLVLSGCMMAWPIYCLIYKKDNDNEKDIQETVLISNAPGSKTDPGAGGFEI